MAGDDRQKVSNAGPVQVDDDGTHADKAGRDTLDAPIEDRRTAAKRFRDLPRGEQWQLVAEQAKVRSRELCLAFENVVAIKAGLKQTRGKRSGKRRVAKFPCLVFVVRRKPDVEALSDDQTIPKLLPAFWTIDGQRQIVAIPTDVVAFEERPRPFAQVGVGNGVKVVTNSGRHLGSGTVTCVIRREHLPNRLYLMSCNHVLLPGERPKRCVLDTGGTKVANVRGPKGRFALNSSIIHDARLAELISGIDITALLGNIGYHGTFATGVENMPEYCFIHGGRTGVIKVRFVEMDPSEEIEFNSGRRILRELIRTEFVTTRISAPGDSGAPLMTGRDGGMFLGMHIAGTDRSSFAIPAWRLMSTGLYDTNREEWSIITT